MSAAAVASRLVTRPSQVPDATVAVFVEVIPESDRIDFAEHLHAGVAFREADGSVHVVEQCWHEQLNVRVVTDEDQSAQKRMAFAIADLGDLQVEAVAMRCRAVAKAFRNGEPPRIGYALKLTDDADLSEEGRVLLGHNLGLSCVTFVLLVFRSASIPLVSVAGWPSRPDDVYEHETLVRHLTFSPSVPREHVTAVKREVGCVRVRPEEAAGACLGDIPADVSAATERAEYVLRALNWVPPTDHQAYEEILMQRVEDAKRRNDPNALARQLVRCGDFFIRVQQLPKAKRLLEQGLALCLSRGDLRRAVRILQRLARIATSDSIRSQMVKKARDVCNSLFLQDLNLANGLHWQLSEEFPGS